MNDEKNFAAELNPQMQALRDATLEIEKHVSTAGWDAPVRVFALVNAKKALAQTPQLAAELPAEVTAVDAADDYTLFSIEQEGLPKADSLSELLAQIYWPETVDGTAISVERIVLPPSAEVNLPENEQEAMRVLQNHPARQDVRMVAARMRDGSTWGALRMREHDADEMVLSGSKLLESLCAALAVTFSELPSELPLELPENGF